jgi:hypothetical protein
MMLGHGEWKVKRAACVRVILSLVTVTRCMTGDHRKDGADRQPRD